MTRAYGKIYDVIRDVPEGRVATYGQVSRIAGGCTARMVGYALAALPEGSDVPWHRIVNRLGRISPRSDGDGGIVQQKMLELEGVRFDKSGRIDLDRYGWSPLQSTQSPD